LPEHWLSKLVNSADKFVRDDNYEQVSCAIDLSQHAGCVADVWWLLLLSKAR
jgi:hypothetical protein